MLIVTFNVGLCYLKCPAQAFGGCLDFLKSLGVWLPSLWPGIPIEIPAVFPAVFISTETRLLPSFYLHWMTVCIVILQGCTERCAFLARASGKQMLPILLTEVSNQLFHFQALLLVLELPIGRPLRVNPLNSCAEIHAVSSMLNIRNIGCDSTSVYSLPFQEPFFDLLLLLWLRRALQKVLVLLNDFHFGRLVCRCKEISNGNQIVINGAV